jgi:3-deoxy-D-arabino-heptulosonate 7-phosphate (DAHP) synthase class II
MIVDKAVKSMQTVHALKIAPAVRHMRAALGKVGAGEAMLVQ